MNPPSRPLQLGFCAALAFAASVSAQIKPVILPEEEDKTPESHQLVWPAEPGVRYEVQRSTNLLNWVVVQGFQAAATGLVQRMPFALESRTLFFRVRQLDEQAPTIATRFPEAGAFAVRRFADLSIGLTDATGVDPASIRLAVGSLGSFTTASKQLAYTNGVITFTSAAAAMGAYGESVPVSLAVADTLGNRATNDWSFWLEVEPQVVTNLFVFGPPQAQLMGQRIGGGGLQPMAAGANRWTLESVLQTGSSSPTSATRRRLSPRAPISATSLRPRSVKSFTARSPA